MLGQINSDAENLQLRIKEISEILQSYKNSLKFRDRAHDCGAKVLGIIRISFTFVHIPSILTIWKVTN